MDDRFFTAFYPSKATVCGRRLTVFSTHHFKTLAAVNSPLLQRQGQIQPKDLVAAVRICRLKFHDDPNLAPSLRDFLWKRRMERDPKLFKSECAKFFQFMDEHCCGPEFWEVVEGGGKFRPLTGPAALIAPVKAMMTLHFSEADAWNMSVGRLQWYNAEAAELEGSERRFFDEAELAEDASAIDAAAPPDDKLMMEMFLAEFGDEKEAKAAFKKWKEAQDA